MFRANRIGTPVFETDAITTSTAAFAFNSNTGGTQTWIGNQMNAVPLADIGQQKLDWVPAAPGTMTANHKWCLVQAFTVTEPLNGDAVGVELNASLQVTCPADAMIVPIVGKLTAAGAGTLLDTITFSRMPTFFGEPLQAIQGNTNVMQRSLAYQTQVVLTDSTLANLPGVYAHGFMYQAATSSALNQVRMTASIRQFNDLQDKAYRDPLR